MAPNHGDLLNALRETGCMDFIDSAGEEALRAMEKMTPELSGMLSAEAGSSLLSDYRQRMLLIYFQALLQELKGKLGQYDPVGLLIGQFKPDAVKAAAADLYAANSGDIQTLLHEKYPLLKAYRECTDKNFQNSFSAFFDAFFDRKEEIEERFLGSLTIRELSGFTTGGADIHRHGRCVIGVKTNAGTFYYKPHDCGLDVFYHEIVSKWFSDCTEAPDVIHGDGYAFISCLQQEPVQSLNAIFDYFYHFGVLSALFHGLGSTDMHHGNIMAVGDKPSAVDIETILGLPNLRTADGTAEVQLVQKDYAHSLSRTCILPIRIYNGPLISPLYSVSSSTVSLPEYEGTQYTVEGFEDNFVRGFHEGYSRILAHREELIEMLKQRSGATVRVLLNNTQFYAVLRQQLFLPDNLTDESAKQKVYGLLRSQYKGAMADDDLEKSEYEWECLLECDIPYFCTALDGRDLCGEDPSHMIRNHFFIESTADAAIRQLERLSENEERFEIELIRNSLAHTPTDLSLCSGKDPIVPEIPDPEIIQEEIAEILAAVKRDAIYCTDGIPMWISTAMGVRRMMYCGNLTMYAGIGAFCASIRESIPLTSLKYEAGQLAGEICSCIRQELSGAKNGWPEKIREILPTGIYAGWGGFLQACSSMERAGVKEAEGLAQIAAELIYYKKLYLYRNLSPAEGAAGLVTALAGMDPNEDDIRECIRMCADRLLGEPLPDRADNAYGCAGTGAAFLSAYTVLKDNRYYQKALEAFQKVHDAFDPKLNGWPDGNARVKFLADKGPHAAGIFLSSECAKDMLFHSELDNREEIAGLLARISNTALESLLEEKELTHSDTLDQGNALTVLALIKAGETEAAGRVLAAMLHRKEQNGSFTVMGPGIRSTFDPSFFMGTLGIGYAMTAYLNALYNVFP